MYIGINNHFFKFDYYMYSLTELWGSIVIGVVIVAVVVVAAAAVVVVAILFPSQTFLLLLSIRSTDIMTTYLDTNSIPYPDGSPGYLPLIDTSIFKVTYTR